MYSPFRALLIWIGFAIVSWILFAAMFYGMYQFHELLMYIFGA